MATATFTVGMPVHAVISTYLQIRWEDSVLSEAQVEAEFAVHANSKGGKDEPIHNFRLATED